MNIRGLFLAAAVFAAGGCSSVYYGTMEKLGVHKRDIMVDRVKAARKSQQETKEQFLTAMEQFKSVVQFDGGDLEAKYNRLNTAFQRSEAQADEVRARIRAIEDVSKALFKEWSAEIKQYTSDTLRASSRKKLDDAKANYASLIQAMKRAESRLDPALAPLRDQVLFMKHNLNAKAISGLSGELVSVQTNVDSLVRDIERSIAEADVFIAALQAN